MRTTLDLDADVLDAARKLAAARGTTVGRVISELARQALRGSARDRHGVPLLPRRPATASPPTMRLVNNRRDDS
jgi:hypothetical protein